MAPMPPGRRPLSLATAVALVWLAGTIPIAAQTGDHVLVVVNANSAASATIGDRYAEARGVPAAQVVRLALPEAEEISREEFTTSLETPLVEWFGRHAAHDRILFIVLTKGVPLRIAGPGGRTGSQGSVDSELALLYRKMTGAAVVPTGFLPNPYFLGDRPPTDAQPFSHDQHDIFIVARLDGFAVEDALGLVERAQHPQATGRVVLDLAGTDDRLDASLRAAAERLKERGLGDALLVDEGPGPVIGVSDVLAYVWNDSPKQEPRGRALDVSFVPGALALGVVSGGMRTMVAPPDSWRPGTVNQRERYYAGAPSPLAADLVRQGATGVVGSVAEPFLDTLVRPDVLLSTYLAGRTLGEAFYLALPAVGWQHVVLGDPLCRIPVASAPASRTVEPGLDVVTELPAHLSARRLEVLAAASRVSREVAAGLLRAEARSGRGDRVGAREALESLASSHPDVALVHLTLAALDETDGNHEVAERRYRRVIELSPSNVIALNNLAYTLSERRGRPSEALPLAERAFRAAPANGNVADTLAWIHHRLGNVHEARRFSAIAVQATPRSAEIRLHAAAILSAAGDAAAARQELQAALKLDSMLSARADVAALVRTLTP